MNALIVVDADECANEIASFVESLGYKTVRSNNASATIDLLKTQSINLIICETLINKDDTIALLRSISNLQSSIIFISDCPSEETYLRAAEFNHAHFLVRPFHALTLRSMIDSLASHTTTSATSKGVNVRNFNGQRLSVSFDKILYISTDKNYSTIHTQQNHYVLKQSLVKLSKALDSRFVQVHKGFWVNIDRITQVHLNRNQLHINESVIPIGKTYKSQFAARWQDYRKPQPVI
ncbi:hypothetical protein GCM10027592_52790 [Spirosoma flavus]